MTTSPSELEEMTQFVDAYSKYEGDHIPEMEIMLRVSTGYSQRVGELLNVAIRDLALKRAENLERLSFSDEETETTRKAKLEKWCADEVFTVGTLKNLYASLRSVKMGLSQSIKTAREQPR